MFIYFGPIALASASTTKVVKSRCFHIVLFSEDIAQSLRRCCGACIYHRFPSMKSYRVLQTFLTDFHRELLQIESSDLAKRVSLPTEMSL